MSELKGVGNTPTRQHPNTPLPDSPRASNLVPAERKQPVLTKGDHTMSQDKDRIEKTISALKQQRDELALQIHLCAMEAKEEFDSATEKLNKMTAEYEPLKDAVEESAGNVMASLKLVGDELLSSFDRIRKSLK
jgi:chromosome segregation ATPase